jgi:hypothetical protein
MAKPSMAYCSRCGVYHRAGKTESRDLTREEAEYNTAMGITDASKVRRSSIAAERR